MTPKIEKLTMRTQRKVPKTGLMLIGLGGNNGCTTVAGILANRAKMSWETKEGTVNSNYFGSVTQVRRRGGRLRRVARRASARGGGWVWLTGPAPFLGPRRSSNRRSASAARAPAVARALQPSRARAVARRGLNQSRLSLTTTTTAPARLSPSLAPPPPRRAGACLLAARQASTVRLGADAGGNAVYIPFNRMLPMVHPNDLVVGGWDISGMNLGEAMKRSKVCLLCLVWPSAGRGARDMSRIEPREEER